jgi:hypothetical protein
MIKILWRSFQIKEVTWEKELEMKKKYPKLFLDSGLRLKFQR